MNSSYDKSLLLLKNSSIISYPFFNSFSVVFSKATLSKLNFEVEEKKREIEKQQKENDSLAMAIDELASLTTIQQVAQSEGLSYNNANIKVVR